jgi:hypothetical protein
VQLDDGTNGFVIDQTGKLDVTIQYKPQSWFYAGLAVSVLSALLALSYLLIRNRRGDRRSEKKNVFVTTKTLPQQDFGISVRGTGGSGKSMSSTRSVLHKLFSPAIPISISLLLLLFVLFLLTQDEVLTANFVMVYVYFILVIGVIWQFVLLVRKTREREIKPSERI